MSWGTEKLMRLTHSQFDLPAMVQTASAVRVQESDPTIAGFTPVAQVMTTGIDIHDIHHPNYTDTPPKCPFKTSIPLKWNLQLELEHIGDK
ncbi:hypothetical protein llap_19802 [Limosa lapponica baueri]|uniref:Uncharacterized protein n=1 Tax=Limosa lapponica baueri TaxID=1758121 RepID=A0A2I0T7W6_LIMLA|nr:hypothetical protein llap_19802 [Limosa lapponica baueri]